MIGDPFMWLSTIHFVGQLRCIRRLAALLLAPMFLAASPVTQAHPHGWVDYTIRVLFNDRGQVTALEQHWKLDPFYSLTLSEELSRAEGDESMQQRLDALGDEIINNMALEHYLSHVYLDGKELEFGQVTEYTTRMSDQRIELFFVLPLATPQSPNDGKLSWKIYDATYYIEFLYDDKTDKPITLSNAPEGCTANVIHYDPDPKMVAKASAIDINDQAPDGMGQVFADTGNLSCPER